jgi:predicted RNase H-like HicB family nuclease
METFHVHYSRDSDGSWFAKARDLQGAHSSGARISAARANIREAIALVLDIKNPTFELSESFDQQDNY